MPYNADFKFAPFTSSAFLLLPLPYVRGPPAAKSTSVLYCCYNFELWCKTDSKWPWLCDLQSAVGLHWCECLKSPRIWLQSQKIATAQWRASAHSAWNLLDICPSPQIYTARLHLAIGTAGCRSTCRNGSLEIFCGTEKDAMAICKLARSYLISAGHAHQSVS